VTVTGLEAPVRPEAKAAIELPADREIVLRTNQTRRLYGYAVLCLAIGLLGAFYYFTKERPFSIADYLVSAVGFFSFWLAWRLAWSAFKGFPQLSILGAQLTYRMGRNTAKVLALNLLGPAEVSVEKHRRAGISLSLAFRNRRDFEALEATGMMEPVHVDGAKAWIPLDGLIGKNRELADETAAVINARRALAITPLTLSDAEVDAINATYVKKRRWYGLGAIARRCSWGLRLSRCSRCWTSAEVGHGSRIPSPAWGGRRAGLRDQRRP
jgi:hypothetical protein